MTYGTFAPDVDGVHFPTLKRIDQDFALMAESGLNTVRVYTVPDSSLLDAALRHGLKVMVGVPWTQHVAFLDDRALARQIRQDTAAAVRSLARHPAVLMFAVGNEVPAPVVRWHGQVGRSATCGRSTTPARTRRPGAPHLRQLPADRVPRPRLLRRLQLQRLPPP
ncbi:MAG: hypothetical protein R2712_13035 [Vicinamibacterales bacterium]